jgi:hypothetical protein
MMSKLYKIEFYAVDRDDNGIDSLLNELYRNGFYYVRVTKNENANMPLDDSKPFTKIYPTNEWFQNQFN